MPSSTRALTLDLLSQANLRDARGHDRLDLPGSNALDPAEHLRPVALVSDKQHVYKHSTMDVRRSKRRRCGWGLRTAKCSVTVKSG